MVEITPTLRRPLPTSTATGGSNAVGRPLHAASSSNQNTQAVCTTNRTITVFEEWNATSYYSSSSRLGRPAPPGELSLSTCAAGTGPDRDPRCQLGVPVKRSCAPRYDPLHRVALPACYQPPPVAFAWWWYIRHLPASTIPCAGCVRPRRYALPQAGRPVCNAWARADTRNGLAMACARCRRSDSWPDHSGDPGPVSRKAPLAENGHAGPVCAGDGRALGLLNLRKWTGRSRPWSQ